MTPEERADFWEALAEYRLNPIPPPLIYIEGFGFMNQEGYDATSSKGMAAGRTLRLEPDGRPLEARHGGREASSHAH